MKEIKKESYILWIAPERAGGPRVKQETRFMKDIPDPFTPFTYVNMAQLGEVVTVFK